MRVDPAGWPPTLVAALTVLAVHRVTRLVVADRVAAGLRARVAYRDPRDPETYRARAGYLIGCPWCVSVYVAAVLTTAAAVAWPWVAWPYLALAASSVTGILGMRE